MQLEEINQKIMAKDTETGSSNTIKTGLSKIAKKNLSTARRRECWKSYQQPDTKEAKQFWVK